MYEAYINRLHSRVPPGNVGLIVLGVLQGPAVCITCICAKAETLHVKSQARNSDTGADLNTVLDRYNKTTNIRCRE